MRLVKNHSCLFFLVWVCMLIISSVTKSNEFLWHSVQNRYIEDLKAKQQKLPWFQWQWWGFSSHQSRLHNFRLVPDVQQSAGRSIQAGWTACDGLQEEQWRKQELNHALMETDKQLVQVKEIGSIKRTTVQASHFETGPCEWLMEWLRDSSEMREITIKRESKCNYTDLWSRWETPLRSCCSRAPLLSSAHLCRMAGCHNSWQPGSRRWCCKTRIMSPTRQQG